MHLSVVLDLIFPVSCLGCGARGTALCAACLPVPSAPVTVVRSNLHVHAVGRYAGCLRRAILAYKRGRRDTGDVLGTLLAACVSNVIPRDAIVVPVPTVSERRRVRGFDQSLRLARSLGERSQRPVVVALRQVVRDAQRGRSRASRLAAAGRFVCVAPQLVEGARVMLVDDVVTTGATLRDCAATLAASGARVCGAVVLAYAS